SSATPITDPTRGIYPTAWGEAAIDPFPTQFVLTYRNFGTLHVNGLDVGLTYDLSQRIRSWVDYSLMRVSGLEQPANDFDGDGDYDELSFNSPEQKATFGVGFADVVTTGLDVELRGRWVEAFDFVSGFYRATEAGRGTGQFQFKDRGPLGGYTSFDLSATYAVSRSTQVNASVMNVFDEPMRQSVGAPPIRRLLRTEVKHTIR
ncbi:MAG: TonB-dependent receptor, partial [Longimicrobiales bacterium]|nr:TonB-dependent receptor [Longimicrobiales bacterium]